MKVPQLANSVAFTGFMLYIPSPQEALSQDKMMK